MVVARQAAFLCCHPCPYFHSSCLSICLSICLLCLSFIIYTHSHKFDFNPPCSSLITSPRININPILHLTLFLYFFIYLFIHFTSFSPGTRRSWGAGNGAAMELPKGGKHIRGGGYGGVGVCQKGKKKHISSHRGWLYLCCLLLGKGGGVPGWWCWWFSFNLSLLPLFLSLSLSLSSDVLVPLFVLEVLLGNICKRIGGFT